MSVLLTICNKYHLSISDFFVTEPDNDESATYENSFKPTYPEASPALSTVTEEFGSYKISKKQPFLYEDFLAAKDQEIALLREINELYKKQIEMLQEKILENSDKNDL